MNNKVLFNRFIAACAIFILLFSLSFVISFSSEKKKNQMSNGSDTAENGSESERVTSVSPSGIPGSSGEPVSEAVPVNHGSVINQVFDQPPKPAPQNKILYLTFDDGPGPYTEKLLDILKKYNVKVTFFVTAMHENYLDLITREAKEGHSVAVHSLTHVYKTIYSGTEAFWKDFNAMEEIIRQKTGSETLLMRFPGGSSNTVSDFTPGIMTTLTKQMKEKGYYYFDWNVDSHDAGGASTPEAVFENLKKGVTDMRISLILCHDVKEYTVNAMESFIPWAIENGYTFLSLTVDDSSFNAHHSVRN